ncbi:alpha/beta hydrolase [Saccharospirillum impatiens]|uniref:alpha/beta hydrolase n=1 Tax=Saccharospirillum impatiens TaxID=169438 RepID=UPI0003FB1140|nr:alpha/beta hydrolase [Saccharospirillum impatiens]
MLYRQFETQEAIDLAYDPSKTADGAAAMARYQAMSAAAMADLKVHADVRFGQSLAETLDLFPATQPGAPLHVFFHGGYWRSLSNKEFSFAARGLVEAGVSVAVVNYALCPLVTLAELVRQCQVSLLWLADHATEYGYDAQRITVSGHSAGGHITGMLLATDWQGLYGRAPDLIKGATAISGLFDLGPFPYSWLQPKLQLTGRDVMALSPLNAQPQVGCPVNLMVGALESDEFHRQSRAYKAHLNAADPQREVVVEAVTDCDHFTIIDGLNDGTGQVFDAIMRNIE